MENALRANPQNVREQSERQLKDLQEPYGEAMLELRARKLCSHCWARTRSDRDATWIKATIKAASLVSRSKIFVHGHPPTSIDD